jgi:biotin operon repressor
VASEGMKVKEPIGFRFHKPLLHLHLGDSSATWLLAFLCLAADNASGESYHSQESISYATGMSKRTIRAATKRLVDMGVVICEVRGTVANKKTNRYQVQYDKLLALAEKGKAGKTEFILSRREHKAKWQRVQRSTLEEVQKGTLKKVQKGTLKEVQKGTLEEIHFVPRTTKYELLTKSTTKELTENPISGSLNLDSRKGTELTTDNIQGLEQEVSRLTALKAEAIHEKRLADYQTYRDQLQKAQTRLNVARNQIIKAAMDSAAA